MGGQQPAASGGLGSLLAQSAPPPALSRGADDEMEAVASTAPPGNTQAGSVFPLSNGFVEQLSGPGSQLFSLQGGGQDGRLPVLFDGSTMQQVQQAVQAAGGRESAVGGFIAQVFDSLASSVQQGRQAVAAGVDVGRQGGMFQPTASQQRG